jgi:hypothetical protein
MACLRAPLERCPRDLPGTGVEVTLRAERLEKDVLRMQRKERGSRRVTLIVEGRIVGEWADVLEDECLDLIRSGFSAALDLTGVVYVSRKGVEALDRLVRIGTTITSCPPLIADLLAEEGIKIGRRKEERSDRILPWRRRDGSDA